jgi:hypothetical protein
VKRIITALTVAAIMVAMVVASAGNAFALAYTPDTGGPSQGTITEQAEGNCEANVTKQVDNEVAAGGGSKEDVDAPTNCDHFFQREGIIGKNE